MELAKLPKICHGSQSVKKLIMAGRIEILYEIELFSDAISLNNVF